MRPRLCFFTPNLYSYLHCNAGQPESPPNGLVGGGPWIHARAPGIQQELRTCTWQLCLLLNRKLPLSKQRVRRQIREHDSLEMGRPERTLTQHAPLRLGFLIQLMGLTAPVSETGRVRAVGDHVPRVLSGVWHTVGAPYIISNSYYIVIILQEPSPCV